MLILRKLETDGVCNAEMFNSAYKPKRIDADLFGLVVYRESLSCCVHKTGDTRR